MSAESAGDPRSDTTRRSVATRARLYLVAAAMLALTVAFGVFVVAWGQYSIRQRTDDLARQVTALARGQAVAGEAGRSAENTATAGPSGRLLRVQAGLIGAGLFVTDAERSRAARND